MATDTRQAQKQQRMTLAELCEAIADEKISYTTQGDEYLLTGRDVRHMGRDAEDYEHSLELLAAELASFSASEHSAQ